MHVKVGSTSIPVSVLESLRRQLLSFTQTCNKVGVQWRRWGRWHMSLARRDSVAKLEEMVGPKR